MELLSEHPVSGEYLSRLQQDLEMAESVRFAVGYITKRGLQAIGVERLARVLQHPDSFGVSSLTCEIGFSPLYALQAHAQVGDRLRYLMGAQDMRVLREELSGPALMHSKLVRIVRRDGIVVVYLGSHNWSGRALGTQDLPRNAEISMRFEEPPGHHQLDMFPCSLSSQVNRHLEWCFRNPLCIPVVHHERPTFERWKREVCGSDEELLLSTVILAVCEEGSLDDAQSLDSWKLLAGSGVYTQIYAEEHGDALWKVDERVLVFCWRTRRDLREGREPVILQGYLSAKNAGERSARASTNSERRPIRGFRAHLHPHVRHRTPPKKGEESKLGCEPLHAGGEASYFDMQLHVRDARGAESVDQGFTPRYQFLLEIERVYVPPDMARQGMGQPWSETWDVYAGRLFPLERAGGRRPMREQRGYSRGADRDRAARQSLLSDFGVDISKAKGVPSGSARTPYFDTRLHPLHETYMGRREEDSEQEWVDKIAMQQQAAVAEVVAHPSAAVRKPLRMKAIQTVRHAPFDRLRETWLALRERLGLPMPPVKDKE